MILVSFCFGGIECRYNGFYVVLEKIRKFIDENEVVMVCFEFFGGFLIFCEFVEIIGGIGEDVFNGIVKIVIVLGEDVIELYMEGVVKILVYVKEINVFIVILKENSLLCGSGFIYNGIFFG